MKLLMGALGIVGGMVAIVYLFVMSVDITAPHIARWTSSTRNQNSAAHFERNMCYVSNGLREPWQTNPDGIIVMKGYQKYLVLPAHEADRVSGGDKIGAEEEIIAFDSNYHQVICPETWLTHKHTSNTPRKGSSLP
jgi:hypothetical protein